MEKLDKLYDGSTKIRYKTGNPDLEILSFKDTVVVSKTEKVDIIGKAKITNIMNNRIMRLIASKGVPTHFQEELNEKEALIKKSSPFPIEVTVRNYASGRLTDITGIAEGNKLKTPIIEFALKKDATENPLINGYYVLALDIASQSEIDKITSYALRINEVLIDYFGRCGIDLIDCKMEFGRHRGEILLIDEISLESCRLWDKETHERLDVDRLRLNLGNMEDAYREIARRIGIE